MRSQRHLHQLAGAFERTCDPGFVGDGFVCVDVDECEVDLRLPHATCRNEPGSFACTCRPGWVGDGLTCRDDDECLRGLCDANATCFNVPGSFACECNAGFFGNGRLCRDIDECQNDPCGVNAVCRATSPAASSAAARRASWATAPTAASGPWRGRQPVQRRRQASAAATRHRPPAPARPTPSATPARPARRALAATRTACRARTATTGNPCTTDSCVPTGGACSSPTLIPATTGTHAPDDAAAAAPVAARRVACDDGNACTTDRCVAGACQSRDIVGACDDGNACTAGDTCVDRVCVGQEVDCEDGDACTVGVCDPASGCDQCPGAGLLPRRRRLWPGRGLHRRCLPHHRVRPLRARRRLRRRREPLRRVPVRQPLSSPAPASCGNGTICEESQTARPCMPEPGDRPRRPHRRHQGDCPASERYEPAPGRLRGTRLRRRRLLRRRHPRGRRRLRVDGDPGTLTAVSSPTRAGWRRTPAPPTRGPPTPPRTPWSPRDATAVVDGTGRVGQTPPRATPPRLGPTVGRTRAPTAPRAASRPQENGDCTCDVGDDRAPGRPAARGPRRPAPSAAALRHGVDFSTRSGTRKIVCDTPRLPTEGKRGPHHAEDSMADMIIEYRERRLYTPAGH
ncbi:MAG: EGF domain-containing protein [bacterium]